MRLLLDTSAFIWLADGDGLSEVTRDLIGDATNEVYLSAASAWEISIKHSLGHLTLGAPPEEYVPQQRRLHRVEPLPSPRPPHCRWASCRVFTDPFDRILVAQAIVEGLTVVTSDRLISMYPVLVVW